MKSLSPVVWFEGMHLGPHQFQAQNRYFEDSIHFSTSALSFENYGVIGCEVNSESLENGQALLVHARGVFPDGLAFEMPESDDVPVSIDLGEIFPPTQDKELLFLAVPPERVDHANYSIDGNADSTTRFIGESKLLCDETTGKDEKPVRLGRKNIRFLLGSADPGDSIQLPIARIMRSGAGRFMLDPTFIPPCLDITASPRLVAMLGTLIEILENRASSLVLSGEEQLGQVATQLTRFWFLHTINASLVPLKHFYSTRRGHPVEVFLEMSRLAGALCTFSLDTHPRSLPLYDHLRLGDCFDALDAHIRRHLEIIIPENCIRIPLHAKGDYFFAGEVLDQRCFDLSSSWILAVRGGGSDVDVISKVPGLVKVCSEPFVPELVKRALPGLVLTHMASPPPAVSSSPETRLFLINRTGPCWDHIKKAKQVGAYVPGDLPGASLAVLVVLES